MALSLPAPPSNLATEVVKKRKIKLELQNH